DSPRSAAFSRPRRLAHARLRPLRNRVVSVPDATPLRTPRQRRFHRQKPLPQLNGKDRVQMLLSREKAPQGGARFHVGLPAGSAASAGLTLAAGGVIAGSTEAGIISLQASRYCSFFDRFEPGIKHTDPRP